MILVTGAAGKTGRAVIEALSDQGGAVRALVRCAEQSQIVQDIGVTDVVVGDMTQDAAFDEACTGINVVYHICPNVSPYELEIGRNLIRSCREQGVNRIVYHSVLHPQTEDIPHHWAKLRVEELILSSGLDYTILQPAAYMQNIQGSWARITAEGILLTPYPVETRISMVDLHDVAEIAVKILLNPLYSGGIFELVGPEALSQVEVARILTEELGVRVSAQEESLGSWKKRMAGSGLGEYQQATLMKMFEYYAKYGFTGNNLVLKHLLDREPTSFRSYIRRKMAGTWLEGN